MTVSLSRLKAGDTFRYKGQDGRVRHVAPVWVLCEWGAMGLSLPASLKVEPIAVYDCGAKDYKGVRKPRCGPHKKGCVKCWRTYYTRNGVSNDKQAL